MTKNVKWLSITVLPFLLLACMTTLSQEESETSSGAMALIEILPGANLDASTYAGSSFIISNNSENDIQILSVSIDFSTAILPDMVFDPVGAGGDATASCPTPNSGAAETGAIRPSDPCADLFSEPHEGGFDVFTISFTNFDLGEQFIFTTDVDPNSIQGVPGAGDAGSVSGYELIGATITVEFSDESILTASLYEEGSLGGAQAIVADNLTDAPVISVDGFDSPVIVNDLDQTIILTGTPGDYYSLLQMDTRLYIASGDAPYNVEPEALPFYANEAMSGQTLYDGEIDEDGQVEIPVTLLQTPGAENTPDGGLNYFIAVTASNPYTVGEQISLTSNIVVLKYDPDAVESTQEP